MNRPLIAVMKTLKSLYGMIFKKIVPPRPICIREPDSASKQIYFLLTRDEPAMIARFGSTELTCIVNYLGIQQVGRPFIGFIIGKAKPWWWNKNIIQQMTTCAGFFPKNIKAVEKFCQLFIQEIPMVDLLGSWLPDETLFKKELRSAIKVDLELLNPYFSNSPWTQALEGKKVLVIHPFADTIKLQYKKRELIFNDNLLPDFDLKTIKAVQSIAGEVTQFNTWFDALDHMKAQMDAIDYDICLIGCGAYGFLLAAHAKRMGKKGFHLGGSLQLLFGIRGKRWENPGYNPNYNYAALMNEHWVKPADEDRPVAANKVENACYW